MRFGRTWRGGLDEKVIQGGSESYKGKEAMPLAHRSSSSVSSNLHSGLSTLIATHVTGPIDPTCNVLGTGLL